MGFLIKVLEIFGENFKKGISRVGKLGKVAWMGMKGLGLKGIGFLL